MPGIGGGRLRGHAGAADRAHRLAGRHEVPRRAGEPPLLAEGGQAKTLKVRLPKGVRAVSRRGTLSLNAITTNRDAAGNLAQRSSRLAIKLVR